MLEQTYSSDSKIKNILSGEDLANTVDESSTSINNKYLTGLYNINSLYINRDTTFSF
jgi:hypothetical protein